ncbi:hypothetical protein N8I77_000137 [Diaporthe amygdali]|uniref:Heterokaryon incompatibility domain-containing protein n=1 Tax=Phomopsis amygdali TaxID=1214568 RepID=A0AAD9SMY9_PHOAM|nr:hypothetical protein N8I77_000137 [Diaporthe amygdali]
MATPYKYNRIDLTTDAIRLTRLLKGDDGQPIRCEIFETFLHQVEGVPYEALSYVWGSEESVDKIWLDECPFQVTKNLYQALTHLRRPDEDRILWIDAICIDQSHNAERSHQVGQMRLVYQNAQRVIVWLGVSNEQIDCLFDWMACLDQRVLTMARPHTISSWQLQWELVVRHPHKEVPYNVIRQALRDILRREWFSRIWVLQEGALAKSAMIICGRKGVSSRTFVVMPSVLNIDCHEGEQARLEILPGVLRANAWWSGGDSTELLTLLRKFGRSKSGDPHDLIYALLGLSTDAYTSDLLRPNYQINLQETVQMSIAYLSMRSRDLPEHSPLQGLPIWTIEEFLDALQDLTFHVFRWAMDHAHDKLLTDLLQSQIEKPDNKRIRQYMSYAGYHGCLVKIAMKKANLALLELILQIRCVDPYAVDSEGSKPLLQLLSQLPGFEVFPTNSDGDTELLSATKRGDLSAVNMLLKSPDFDLSLVDGNGDGPLNIAVRRGYEEIVELLLKESKEEHRKHKGSDGWTPFELALMGGPPGIIGRLLDYEHFSVTEAVLANRSDLVCRILDFEPRQVEGTGLGTEQTPLRAAAKAGKTNMVALLLDRGAEINSTGECETSTALWLAASHGHLETVRYLIEKGADIELMSLDGTTKKSPLWAAASKGHGEIVMCLLNAGAKAELEADDLPAIKDRPESAIILWAATHGGHMEIVRAFEEEGVDVQVS